MNNMRQLIDLVNFKQRKTFGEAIILYLVTVGGVFGTLMLLSFILATVIGLGAVGGFWLGIIGATSATIFLSLRILNQRKLSSIKKMLLLVGVVLTGAYGIFVGLIPLLIVAISQENAGEIY